MQVTPFDLAQRFLGQREVQGGLSNPVILAMLRLDQAWPEGDEVPWCSAFVNFIAWLLRLPRSKSLAARSWLRVGRSVPLAEAKPGFHVVVLSRGADPRWGHVGFYAGMNAAGQIEVLGGNQGDSISILPFPVSALLGVRDIS